MTKFYTPTTEDEPTRVIFRRWKDDGSIIALMPDMIETASGLVCCYQHIGQHGTADYQHVIRSSRPATPAEYAPLFRELTTPPYEYKFQICQRRQGRKR